MNNNYYFKRQRVGLLVIGGFMTLLIAFSMTPTFAGLVAKITNSMNTASTGKLVMEEKTKDDSVTCTTEGQPGNTATCATINKYGGTTTPLVPGGTGNVVEINIANKGTIAATSFTVQGGSCTSTPSDPDLCAKINVKIESGTKTIYNGTAKAFTSPINILSALSKTTINVNETVPIKITTSLDASADHTYQAETISQPISWQFGV